jgi:LacI family transcriptional regulator
MPTKRKVALLIEATSGYARGLLHGVAQYNHEHAGWTVYFEPHSSHELSPKWLKGWNGDGILARVVNQRIAAAVLALGVPVVELRRMLTIRGLPSIGPDNCKVATLAAEHLRERGFRHFGFCGLPRGMDPPMDLRADAFRKHIEGAGFACSLFHAERGVPFEQEQRRIAQWVRALPKPAGVMACHDDRGLQVLRACMRVGVKVPDQAAVIGVGNDDCLCDLAQPPLSTVDLAPQFIGYEAAALLDRMMAGKPPPAAHIQVPPRGIVTRLSTDVLATEDLAVAQAVGFIRSHACEGIRVGDVLQDVNLSRSALEARLKRVIGRTIHQEIHRVRLERAKVLLSTTDQPIKQITSLSGFRTVQYLARVFRNDTGLTLARYRKRM